MKNKKSLLLIIFVMMFSLFLFMYLFPPKEYSPAPDSGFDSSFDSGGSDFSSSSDWGSDSSGGGSGKSIATQEREVYDEYFSDGFSFKNYINFFFSLDHLWMFGLEMFIHSFIFLFIYFTSDNKKKAWIYYGIVAGILLFIPSVTFVIIEFFGMFIRVFKFSSKERKRLNGEANFDYNFDDCDLTNTGLDADKIHKEVYDIYVKVQEAWMNFTLDDVKDILSDELYNQYITQDDTLKVKNQRNVMSDFKYLICAIRKVEEKDNTQIINTVLQVQCKDYIIDDNTKKVLRGNENTINTYTYELEFEKSKDTVITKCPSCGADLDPKGQSVTCEYCKAKIVRKSSNLVLRKKRMLRQE